MNTPILIAISSIIIVLVIFAVCLSGKSTKYVEKYKYYKKKSIVTNRELDFYKRLNGLLSKRCYIFPQAHLSTFLGYKIKGQNWQGAFSHINEKSVDFLLCEKDTLEPICAVELDDKTHDNPDRIKRDMIVGTILKQAKVPLVRFRNIAKISDKDILRLIGDAIKHL